MADEIREGQRQATGIFIPYEKLLENLDHKLDKILEKLEGKLDVRVFESFRSTYEERQRDVQTRIGSLEKINAADLAEELKTAKEDIDQLERDKVGREAVQNYRKYMLSGGGLVGLLVLADLIVRFGQLAHAF